ncbi:phage protease [Hydrogenimonas thermophila]|uniref:Mu-like prophage I protein n=1 Tax=Hydrogenimonas thermophila TaxID=223786 RepID=A0A1I5RRQ6_9BACT|nr:phage protease [Hydrogenimonas thermophila]SFP60616.1 Mu-like prophage I protein [Hydrogenimonas thermophila]
MSKLLLEMNANSKTKEVKISPVGLFSGYDGRVYKLNETTIAATKQRGLDIPLNIEHCFTQKGCAAVGWFKLDTLELKEDGVYAQLELTKEGQELVSSKTYRYLSPEFSVDGDRNVVTIDAVALLNTPNFNLEINQRGPHYDNNGVQLKQKDSETKVSTPNLGAGTSVPQNQNLGAGTSVPQNQKPKEENEMDEKELEQLRKEKEELSKELKLQKEFNQKLIDDLKTQQLDEAVKANKILPAEKELLKEMNIDTLRSYLATRQPLGHTKEFNTNTNQQAKEDSAYAIAANLGWGEE